MGRAYFLAQVSYTTGFDESTKKRHRKGVCARRQKNGRGGAACPEQSLTLKNFRITANCRVRG